MIGRVQDLSRVLVGRSDDDETTRGAARRTISLMSLTTPPREHGVDSHVKDARHAQFAARPLSLVPLQPGVHRILELADDGDRPFGTGQVSLFVPVYGLFTSSVEPGSVRGKQGRDRRW